jgi:hypothetical protein
MSSQAQDDGLATAAASGSHHADSSSRHAVEVLAQPPAGRPHRLRQSLAGGRGRRPRRYCHGVDDAGHDGLDLLVDAVVEGAAVANAAELDAEAPSARPRAERLLVDREGWEQGRDGLAWIRRASIGLAVGEDKIWVADLSTGRDPN